MRVTLTATALAATLLLSGCGGGDDEGQAVTPGSSAAPAAGGDRNEALRKAIEGYANAQMSGDMAGVSAYLHPTLCSEDDKAEYMAASQFMEKTAKGASIKIKAVRVVGDRGSFTEYELSKDASDAVRRLMKQNNKGDSLGWVFYDGEWYRDAGCVGASAEPTSSS